jgi:NOL1/NOP2/sun family putative RNA methylase
MKEESIFNQDFYKRLKQLVDTQTYRSILKAYSCVHKTTFRVNRIKTSNENAIKVLQDNSIPFKQISWYPDAFIIDASKETLMNLDIYKNGSIYVQSLSSMLPVLVMDTQPNDKILDIASAPGSKTTQIASILNNTGEILANDNSHIRIYKLKANLLLQGVTNTHVVFGAGQILWKQYPEYFDKTLVDVPCSMEGRFNTAIPSTYDHWSLSKVKELSERQKWLLRSAISATKVNGIIVYSTCTLSPEENEGVIDWILKKEKGRVVVEDIHKSFPLSPSISKWNDKEYAHDVTKTKRIIPTSTMEGFYVAKLRKIESTIPSFLRNTIE